MDQEELVTIYYLDRKDQVKKRINDLIENISIRVLENSAYGTFLRSSQLSALNTLISQYSTMNSESNDSWLDDQIQVVNKLKDLMF